MASRNPMLVADCPECETLVRFERMPKLGALIVCNACQMRLEVVDVEPIELDWITDAIEDDYDDEDMNGDYDPDIDDDDDDYDNDYRKKPSKGGKRR
jgi:lysine biosynthesis protein LysW